MIGLQQISLRAPLEFTRHKPLEFYNVERVRSYLENNLGCSRKEVIRALDLNPRTVAKAIKIIRGQS